MTQNLTILRPKIALYEPDIPQNTAAIIRTCACLGAKLEIIEPCGFVLTDKRFKRVVMDYMDERKITFYNLSYPILILAFISKASEVLGKKSNPIDDFMKRMDIKNTVKIMTTGKICIMNSAMSWIPKMKKDKTNDIL